jgi:hypothetical protein
MLFVMPPIIEQFVNVSQDTLEILTHIAVS